jgi:hypothetical protein
MEMDESVSIPTETTHTDKEDTLVKPNKMESFGKSLKSNQKQPKEIGKPSQQAKVDEKQDAKVDQPKTPEQKQEEKKELQEKIEKLKLKFKAKVNGVEEDVELDEDTIKRDFQKWKAADKMFQDAAMTRKQNDAFIHKMKSPEGVAEVLAAFGHNVDQLAEQYIADKLNLELMTPEQKRIHQLEMENRRLSQSTKSREAQENQARENQAIESKRTELQTKIIDVLSKEDLPQSPETVRRIARQLKIHAERGVFLEPSDVVGLVKKEIENEIQTIISKYTPEQIKKYIPKEKLDEFRKWELSQIKNPTPAPREKIENVVRAPEPKSKHFKTDMDFRKRMDAIRNASR